MTKLNDLHAILLSTAAQRDNGSLLPVSETITGPADRVTKAITALVKRGLAEERETSDRDAVHRSDGDLAYGVFMTEAGSAAIGVSDTPGSQDETPPSAVQNAAPERQTKAATVIALLERDGGATIAELIAATGWLPHTMRAALTGLRKKGHQVERSKRGGETCYRIVAAA